MTTGGFGNSPWGQGWNTIVGSENIPFTDEWDIFDLSGVRQPDDMARVLAFIEVSTAGDGSMFANTDPTFTMCSGGGYPEETAVLYIDRAVGESFTAYYDLQFNELPVNFSDVVNNHLYVGAWSAQDYAAGFFFSQVGVLYTGEVEYDVGGDIVVVQDTVLLPGSDTWIQEGERYVIRVALNGQTQLLYLFITPKDVLDNGGEPVLRAILAARPTDSGTGTDNIVVSARGVFGSSADACVEFWDYRMSSKFLVDNLAPVADAGDDQANRLCGIVELDGTRSFDPEGEELTYEWRLIDAPQNSMFVVEGSDGVTQPELTPSGFTDRFYSDTLGEADAVEPIQPGDVLTMIDGSFTVVTTGTDSGNFYIEVEYNQIKDNYAGVAFKLVRQAGVSSATGAKPTFYPDVLGFYMFDLRVNDGVLSSSPLGTDRSRVLINVVESPLPRACPVDASFMFDYMLSFWRLVEDRDRIGTFFEVISRNSATAVFTLWQLEYSRSLRDIQRQFIHRWLHYDLLLPEPLPALTRLKYIWSGVRSQLIQGTIQGIGASRLVVTSPRLPEPVEVYLSSPSPAEPERYARELEVRLRKAIDPSFSASVSYTRAAVYGTTSLLSVGYPADVVGLSLTVTVDNEVPETVVIGTPNTSQELVAEIAAGLPGASVTMEGAFLRIGSRTSGASSRVEIDAASTLLVGNAGPLDFDALSKTAVATILVLATVPFTFTSLSTAPGFSYPAMNSLLGGLTGQKMAERTFRVSHSLVGQNIAEDDLLVIDRQAYRIVQVVNDPSDDFSFQRVVVKDALPVELDAALNELPTEVEWSIPGWVQSELINFYNGMVDRGDYVDFEASFSVEDVPITELVSTIAIGVSAGKPNRLGVDTATLAGALTGAEETVRLARCLRRHYLPIDPTVEHVPLLSEFIAVEDPDTVLRRNVDFFIEEFRGTRALRFSAGIGNEAGDVWEGERPPFRLWAEYTYFDNEALIEANFGAAIGLTRDKVPDTVDYLSAVRGIWYALYNGPTLANLRIALQIFLGLPFAEVPGVIEEIRTDFFSQQGRILIRDADNPVIVRSYVYPSLLAVELNPATGELYKVGDVVKEFAPLVTGVEVTDWVKDPRWFAGIVNQGVFYEPQKYHTFLVRVVYEAFDLGALGAVQGFIDRIKPVYTDPFYSILFTVSGDGDEIDVTDSIEYLVRLQFQDALCNRMGAGYTFDQPWASGAEYGEAWRNDFDEDDDPGTAAPTYPGPSDAVSWGFDKNWLCPDDVVLLEWCEDFNGSSPPSNYVWSLSTSEAGPQTFPYDFALGVTPFTATLTRWSLRLNGATSGITVGDWVVEVLVNAVVMASAPLVLGALQWTNPGPTQELVISIPNNVDTEGTISIAVTAGDTLAVRVRPTDSSTQNPGWTSFEAAVSSVVSSFSVPPTVGTFCLEVVEE